MRKALYALYAAAALILTGCASKDPMDYLPEGMFYMGMNMQVVESQPGAKRLFETMEKINTDAGSNEKVTKMFMSFSPPQGSQPKFYGVIIGQAGMSADGFAQAKKSGGTDTKVGGRKAVQMTTKTAGSPSVYLVELSDTAMAMVSSTADFDVMVNTSKKKNPSALAHAPFQKLMGLNGSHAIAATVNTGTILSTMGPQLQMLSSFSPKGKEALQKVQTAAFTLDWNDQPIVEATLYASAEDGKEIANLATMGLQMVKASGKAGPAAGLMEGLQVNSGADGAKITLALPKEQSEAALTKLEAGVATLPEDKDARQKAVQAAVMSAVMGSGMVGGQGGQQVPGGQPAGAPSFPQAQPQMPPGAAFTPAPAAVPQ